jgi:hypothetical protein
MFCYTRHYLLCIVLCFPRTCPRYYETDFFCLSAARFRYSRTIQRTLRSRELPLPATLLSERSHIPTNNNNAIQILTARDSIQMNHNIDTKQVGKKR